MGNLYFFANKSSVPIYLTNSDTEWQPDSDVTVCILDADNYNVGSPACATTITDDDPRVLVEPSTLTLGPGETGEYTVSLNYVLPDDGTAYVHVQADSNAVRIVGPYGGASIFNNKPGDRLHFATSWSDKTGKYSQPGAKTVRVKHEPKASAQTVTISHTGGPDVSVTLTGYVPPPVVKIESSKNGYEDKADSAYVSLSVSRGSLSDLDIKFSINDLPTTTGWSNGRWYAPSSPNKQLDPDETYKFCIESGDGYDVGDPDCATITVYDDDDSMGHKLRPTPTPTPPPSTFTNTAALVARIHTAIAQITRDDHRVLHLAALRALGETVDCTSAACNYMNARTAKQLARYASYFGWDAQLWRDIATALS